MSSLGKPPHTLLLYHARVGDLIDAAAPPLVAALNVSVCLVAAAPVLVADAAMS